VLAVVLLAGVLAWHVTANIAQPADRWVLPDLAVYRAAVDAALAGQPVYAGGLTDRNLPWLYPPFALIVLAPLAWLPEAAAKVTISLLSLTALAYSCRLSWRATSVDRTWLRPLIIATTAILIASEPMQGNLMMGQVNVVLAALVLTDVLLPTGHRGKGVWVGLAAGVKLTPALVIVYYLLRRDWVAARNALVALAATMAVGAVAFPGQSWTYWTHAVLADRMNSAHLGNQSLLGALLRIGATVHLDEPTVRVGWLVLAGAAGLGAVWLLARVNPDPLGTYCGLAAITLLVSPLSWTPHWISLVPMVIWLAGRQPRLGRVLGMLLALGLLLFAWPMNGTWWGLMWFAYLAHDWAGAPEALRTLGWCVLGSLYPILGGVALAKVCRSAGEPGPRTLPEN